MLEKIYGKTIDYISSMSKQTRKKYGQFFTDINTARFMAKLFSDVDDKETINVLDPGAGTGILSCALIERFEKNDKIKAINLTCYEDDSNVINILTENLEEIKNNSCKTINVNIINDNYILSQQFSIKDNKSEFMKYDFIISNPPYLKISSKVQEAIHMKKVCYGAPNLYFLFASMSIYNLKAEGEMVYIMPRSWTSGAYFSKFREYMINNTKFLNIHLFSSREKIFKSENILQETIILRLKKTQNIKKNIIVTSSYSTDDITNSKLIEIPYDVVVSNVNNYVFLPINSKEIDVLKKINKFEYTLPKLGLKMKTGIVVDFRNKDLLENIEKENTIPLLYSQHINGGKIKFPIGRENEYLKAEKKGLIQKNENYLMVKRFTSKEESRRIQCAMYLASEYPKYKYISTQNKINFIVGENTELTPNVLFGLYVIFNSTIYDMYYRILNGSTQVNSTEINCMPIPTLYDVGELGKKLAKYNEFSTSLCDKILEEYYE